MNIKVQIMIVPVIILCLLPCMPNVEAVHNEPISPSLESEMIPQDTVGVMPVGTKPQHTRPPQYPVTTLPPKEPIVQPETQVPKKHYSDDPVINDFINARILTWKCPLKDSYKEITGSRRFATSRSDGKRAHAGLDFVAPHGTKVYAITSGTVQSVSLFFEGTYSVQVLNDDGSVLRYCEIAPAVGRGDRVEQGDQIGSIKRAEGGTQMLHMELYFGDCEGELTQTWNHSYAYVNASKNFLRRSDLMDPTFLKDLPVG